ncbi:MAG: hypothetical protein AABY93_16010 [Bacteroidota bacterium]
MKRILGGIGLLMGSICSLGQTLDERAEVMKPIDQLFNGMKLGDSSIVHATFTKKVSMATIGLSKDGKPSIRFESTLDEFLKAVGTPHPDVWNEVIWDTKIEIDGSLAQAWAPYAFYVGKKFSHCGVDAFQLFKGAEGTWKIFQLSDTRQKEGCQVPTKISEQFK